MFAIAAKTIFQGQKRRFFHASANQLAKLNVEGLAEKVNLEGQNVLMRVDLNVPLSKEVRKKAFGKGRMWGFIPIILKSLIILFLLLLLLLSATAKG